MPAPIMIAGLPPYLQLPAGYIIQLGAYDQTTGAAVTGVTVTNVAIEVEGSAAFVGSVDDTPLPLLVPTAATG